MINNMKIFLKMREKVRCIETKNLLCAISVVFFLCWCVINRPYLYCADIIKILFSNAVQDGNTDDAGDVERKITENLIGKSQLIDVSGALTKMMGKREVYTDLFVDEDGVIVNPYAYTSTDYETEQIIGFYDFLKENGINFLYVNMPVKSSDDADFEKYGIESFGEANADRLIKRLKGNNIPAIDLREEMVTENLNSKDMFYRTDHHWNTRSGLWATRHIAEGLNTYCGYSIDTSIYNEENYDIKEWQDCWLGEQGCKIGKSYAGLDNYCEIKPDFYTEFIFRPIRGDEYKGSFDGFVDESRYDISRDKYDNDWYYSYSNWSCVKI